MNQTQRELCDAFWQLLEEKPYRRITVRDIVERCRLNRNTFYYHFQDIPSLAEFSVKAWIDQTIKENRDAGMPEADLTVIAREAYKHRNALMHIYRFSRRENFIRYLYEISLYITRSCIDDAPNKEKLKTEDLCIFEKICNCTIAGLALDWLDAGGSYELSDFAEKLGSVFHIFSGNRQTVATDYECK